MGRGTRGAVEGDGRGISGSHGARRRVGQEKRWHRGCSPRRAMRSGHASPQVSTPVPQPLGRDRAGAASVPAPLRVPPGWACTTASARPCRATRAVQAARPARARKEKPPRCQKPPPLHAGLCRSLIATAIRGRSSRCARDGRSSRVTVILPDGRPTERTRVERVSSHSQDALQDVQPRYMLRSGCLRVWCGDWGREGKGRYTSGRAVLEGEGGSLSSR